MNINITETEINEYTASAEAFGVRYENLTAVQAAKIDLIRAKAVLKTDPDNLRAEAQRRASTTAVLSFENKITGSRLSHPETTIRPSNVDDKIEVEKQAIIAAAKLKIEKIASQAPNLVRKPAGIAFVDITLSPDLSVMNNVSADGEILPLDTGTELEVDLSDPSDPNPDSGPFVSTNAAILASHRGLDWRSVKARIQRDVEISLASKRLGIDRRTLQRICSEAKTMTEFEKSLGTQI